MVACDPGLRFRAIYRRTIAMSFVSWGLAGLAVSTSLRLTVRLGEYSKAALACCQRTNAAKAWMTEFGRPLGTQAGQT